MLINCQTGAENELLKELKKIDNVEEAYAVYGAYDIIIKIKADTEENLKNISAWKIRRLDRIRSTLTMIVMEGA
jgi:DNA-binding Lrp family transcriptional regulator